MEDIELITYQIIVSRLADSRSNITYYNSGKEHAIIVLNNLLKSSSKKINLLTGFLDEKVCSDSSLLKSLEDYLYRGGEINIIFTNFNLVNKDSLIINTLKKFSKKVNSYFLTENIQNTHFLTSDDEMYRYEYDIENYKAEFCFNNESKTAKLNDLFDKLKVQSTKFQF